MIPRVVLLVSRTRARVIRANAQWGSHIQRVYRQICEMESGAGYMWISTGDNSTSRTDKTVMIPL